MNRHPDIDSTDELLWEWGAYFRDRRQFERCRSIESRFNAYDPEVRDEGWGEPGPPLLRPPMNVRRVLKTHDAVQQLPVVNKWALTYGYAYPYLPKFVVLRAMRKYTGRRLAWQAFMDALDVARFRVHTTISLTTATFAYRISRSS
jgi:hypothetical protein